MTELNANPVHSLLTSQKVYRKSVDVTLSYSIIRLLSEQLYQSPLKAIEELVVNAYDAHAKICRIYVPTYATEKQIAIYDDGDGMDYDGLVNLWQIGHSNKRDEEIERRSQRKQIGKFGIGKLATYTIANQLTYITKSGGIVLGVTIDFGSFEDASKKSDPSSGAVSTSDTLSSENKQTTVSLNVHEIENLKAFVEPFRQILQKLGITVEELSRQDSWTVAILENLREKGKSIKYGRLEWVLRTAMPRTSTFQIYLNDKPLNNARQEYEPMVQFTVADLPEKRLYHLSDKTGEKWTVDQDRLITPNLFRQGISGTVVVTERTLTGGKSQDLGRSHGFFIRVRDRLINEDDPLFGLNAQVHDTFNRLDAQIRADDLDAVLTASRDSIEATRITEVFQELLRQIFQEADSQYKRKRDAQEKGKKEGERER